MLAKPLLLVLLGWPVLAYSSFLLDITDDIFKQTDKQVIAAFGDFDADKQTDILVVDDKGKL